MTTPADQVWRAHWARWAAPCVGVVVGALGLLAGQPGLVLLGAPLILAGVWATSGDAQPQLRVGPERLEVTPAGRAQAIRVRVTREGYRPTHLLLTGRPQRLTLTLRSARTGPQPLTRVDWDAHGAFLLSHTSPAWVVGDRQVVLPQSAGLDHVPSSQRLRGLTGPLASPRAGDGYELRDIHPMVAGDSPRRIDWRATARQTQPDAIWVRGTHATGEPVAVLVMDSRDEVGPDLHTWRGTLPLRVDEATSLDVARHAAASIAQRLITTGARVGLADLASPRRVVTPATGRRHLNRLIYALALSAPVGSPRVRVRPPQVPADAIVYLFTTLLDDEPVRLAHALSSQGHRVLVVDTLPQVRPAAEFNLDLAWRITAAERRRRIQTLTTQQIWVIAWRAQQRNQAPHRLRALHRTWSRRRP
jgi:uncharacterized protein (DUF58 family)